MGYAWVLMLGGNERYSKENFLFRRFIELAGGRYARIVIIPTASSFPEDTASFFARFFRGFGVNSVDVAWLLELNDISSRYEDLVEDASGIFFTGGDQERILRVILDSPIHDILKRKMRENVVIAGTSAGAMVFTKISILGSNSYGLYIEDVKLGRGLGLLEDFVVDTHFIERNRFWRLLHVVSKHNVVGIGISEDTGVLYDTKYRDFEVLGSAHVTLISPPMNYRIKKNKIQVIGAEVSIVMDGEKFYIKNKKVIFR